MWLLTCLLSFPLHAQSPRAPGVAPDRAEERVTIVEGSVRTPQGDPVEGAVVVSDAGGKAVTGSDGAFRLALELPLDAARVRVTAIGGSDRRSVAHASVDVHPGSTSSAGTLRLASGGCEPAWLPTFGEQPGLDAHVAALTLFDTGGGPELYVGGYFSQAGASVATKMARWKGTSWSAVPGSPTNGFIWDFALFDDGLGGGTALYAGGTFTNAGGAPASGIARWDGSSWTTLGSGLTGTSGHVFRLAVFDDGQGGGPALYAAGEFTSAGGAPANRIARWDGTSWSALGSGTNNAINALAVFDDGSGAVLVAGGDFTSAGGAAAPGVASWDGTGWTALGSSRLGSAYELAVFDSGNGPELYASNAGFDGFDFFDSLERWTGTSWTQVGGPFSYIGALGVFDDGSGPELWVSVDGIRRYDGSSWSPPDTSLGGVETFAALDDGNGPVLYAGGTFTTASGKLALRVARRDGASWSALGTGSMTDRVNSLALFDDGDGASLYAAGYFDTGPNERVAEWDGTEWVALGGGVNAWATSLAVYDDGGGPDLYAGGYFSSAGGVAANRVARWNGASWSALGSGLTGGNPYVNAMTVFDDGNGPALYVGGTFNRAGGLISINIARWTGSAWSPFGNLGGEPFALAEFDDGSGPALYVAGTLNSAGGVPANCIAKWDGASWSALGSGIAGSTVAYALGVFDDGSGPALYVGGSFSHAGGQLMNNIARWDGASWSPLVSGTEVGVNGPVVCLLAADLGDGPRLYAAGSFTSAGGTAATQIAAWDGGSWAPLGNGTSYNSVYSLLLLPNAGGGPPALVVGGDFFGVPDSSDSYVALWQGCDGAAPVLSCSDVYKVDRFASGPGEIVTFEVTALDAFDPAPSIVCVPPSGSLFPPGSTLVQCTATDAAGNEATCEFEVHVAPRVRSEQR